AGGGGRRRGWPQTSHGLAGSGLRTAPGVTFEAGAWNGLARPATRAREEPHGDAAGDRTVRRWGGKGAGAARSCPRPAKARHGNPAEYAPRLNESLTLHQETSLEVGRFGAT